jgi:hypothetical protein
VIVAPFPRLAAVAATAEEDGYYEDFVGSGFDFEMNI